MGFIHFILNCFKYILLLKKKKTQPCDHQFFLCHLQYAAVCVFHIYIGTLLNKQENGFLFGKVCQIPEYIFHLFQLL